VVETISFIRLRDRRQKRTFQIDIRSIWEKDHHFQSGRRLAYGRWFLLATSIAEALSLGCCPEIANKQECTGGLQGTICRPAAALSRWFWLRRGLLSGPGTRTSWIVASTPAFESLVESFVTGISKTESEMRNCRAVAGDVMAVPETVSGRE
jgi:hypothetical protein